MKPSYLSMSAALLVPAATFAQMSDGDNCRPLTQAYQTYVSTIQRGHGPEQTPIDAQNAIDQRKAGNTRSWHSRARAEVAQCKDRAAQAEPTCWRC
jgi:hypothetical protein